MVKVIVMWLLAMCLSLLGEANAETPLSYGRFAVVYKEGYKDVVGGVFGKDEMPEGVRSNVFIYFCGAGCLSYGFLENRFVKVMTLGKPSTRVFGKV